MDSNSPQLHGGPVVKILASIVVGMDLIPGQGTKIPCAAWLRNKNSKNNSKKKKKKRERESLLYPRGNHSHDFSGGRLGRYIEDIYVQT